MSALRKLAKRHGVMAAEVEELVETGVMFDLYETVKGSVRISDRSFSIKKLEPLYMPAGRIGVTNAVDSMVQYSVYWDAVDKGQNRVAKDIFAANKGLQPLRLPEHLEAAGLAAEPDPEGVGACVRGGVRGSILDPCLGTITFPSFFSADSRMSGTY